MFSAWMLMLRLSLAACICTDYRRTYQLRCISAYFVRILTRIASLFLLRRFDAGVESGMGKRSALAGVSLARFRLELNERAEGWREQQ